MSKLVLILTQFFLFFNTLNFSPYKICDKVSELLEGHRAASIAYSKFSRNIAVELSLPVSQRTSDGFDFIVTCRNELDRLIEQSPNIPAVIVKEFASRFANSAFFKPDILDIRPVTIYKNDAEAEAAERARILKKEKEDRLAIIREEEERRQALIKEIQTEKNKQEIELTKKIEEIKKTKKNTIGFSNVEDNLDKLLEKIGKNNPNTLDTSSDEQSQMSTIINDLVKPTTMSKEKVQSIIEEKLNVTPSASPSASTTSEESSSKLRLPFRVPLVPMLTVAALLIITPPVHDPFTVKDASFLTILFPALASTVAPLSTVTLPVTSSPMNIF